MTPSRLQTIIDQYGLPRLTKKTITRKDDLLQELDKIRQQGYATDDEECEIGHRCVSVPLYDYTGTVAAAVSAFDSAERLTDEYIETVALPALRSLAKEISFRMGHSK